MECVHACRFFQHRTHPHIFNEQSLQLLCFAEGASWPLASRRLLFSPNMYLTIISDLSLASGGQKIACCSPLRNYESDPLFILFAARRRVAQKVKENLFWTEHYLFMVHLAEAWAARSGSQKEILHPYIIYIFLHFSRAPALSYISAAPALHSAPAGVISLKPAVGVCFGAWAKSA